MFGKRTNPLYRGSFDDDLEVEESEPIAEELEHKEKDEVPGGAFAVFSGAPRYHSFRVRGVLHGQKVTVLIDSGAT